MFTIDWNVNQTLLGSKPLNCFAKISITGIASEIIIEGTERITIREYM